MLYLYFLISGFIFINSIISNISAELSSSHPAYANPIHVEISSQTAKPWAYWWWMGSSVTREGIHNNLIAYKEAGIGGLHIIPIYGEKGDEENYNEYLSPKWMEMLEYTLNEADRLGIGIDMTTGTGWPFGGPVIDTHTSAKRLELISVNFKQRKNIHHLLRSYKGASLVNLMAQKTNGTYVDITDWVSDNGDIQNKKNYHKGIALLMQPTLQKVKRAAPGGEGLVMDYFNKGALNSYFESFEDAFKETRFSSGKVRAFYNDSYEVSRANFTSGFLEKFKKLRHYQLTEYLDVLLEPDSGELKERIITDFCETISDLLLSEFTMPWLEKSHDLGMICRNQAHGSPGNLLDLYGAADIPETESFGPSKFTIPGLRTDPDYDETTFGRPNPLIMKFASSAAHIRNRRLVASETATWLGDHFKVALSQVKPQVDELFTAGINHIFYHGITYNPPGKPFPGRLFYASTNFGPSSHFWSELPALNRYIEDCQTILQNSTPDNDLLVYYPIHDAWAKKYNKDNLVPFSVHHSKNWFEDSFFGELVSMLWEKGFSFDYISDKMISEATVKDGIIELDGGNYKAIVIPRCTYMPEQTLNKLAKLADKGADVIFQEDLPSTVPGYYDLERRKEKFLSLKEEIRPVVSITTNIYSELLDNGILNEEIALSGLSYIRKQYGDSIIYFISNLGDKFYEGSVHLSKKAECVRMFDPLTGNIGLKEVEFKEGKTVMNLQLEPGQSCFLICSDMKSQGLPWTEYSMKGQVFEIHTEWTIAPKGDGKNLPEPFKTKLLKSWTEFGDTWSFYSGKAVYSTVFDIEKEYLGRDLLIDLGDVREVARINFNGNEIGLLWCLPFKTILLGELIKERNILEIEVGNLSFNKIIEMERKGIPWKNFHDINFVNIRYEPYNASGEKPLKSGLLSQVKLMTLSKSTGP